MRTDGQQKKIRSLLAALPLALICLAILPASGHAASFYHLVSAVTLPGNAPGWDYLTYDATRSHLFIGRRHDGVTVFDVATHKVIETIAGTDGANKAILVPQLDRGFSVNANGTSTEFALSSLKTIRHIRFGQNADAGSYEPITGQLFFTMGESHKVAFVEAHTGKLVATLPLDSGNIEASAPDGRGNIFVAERDRDKVVRIDARTHAVTASWSTTPCHQPVGLDFDPRDQRIFVGCRSDQPMLAVLDSTSGALVSTLPIGRGNDGVVYDAATHLVYTANGIDANLVVIRQSGANHYQLDQAITTRPMARTLALDMARDRVYLVEAEGGVNPTMEVNTAVAPFYPNFYFDRTFTVLTYQRN